MTHAITLSEPATALLRLHVEREGRVAVDDSTRGPYRELAKAGLMVVGHSFRDGRESFYKLTQAGLEFFSAPSPGRSAARRA